jgi:hypothetical protein
MLPSGEIAAATDDKAIKKKPAQGEYLYRPAEE